MHSPFEKWKRPLKVKGDAPKDQSWHTLRLREALSPTPLTRHANRSKTQPKGEAYWLQSIVAILCGAAILIGQLCYGGVMRPVFAIPAYLVVALAGMLALPSLRHTISTGNSPILALPLALWVIGQSITSADVWLGSNYLHLALASMVIYLTVGYSLIHPKARLTFVALLLLGGTMQACIGLAQVRGWLPHIPQGWYSDQLRIWYDRDYSSRASGTYINPNHLCWFLNTAGLFALAYGLLGRGRAWVKFAAIAIAGLMLYASTVTLSRGGILSLAAGFLTSIIGGSCVLGSLWLKRSFGQHYQRYLPFLAAMLVIPIATLYFTREHHDSVRKRFDTLLKDDYRPELWEVAWKKIEQSPWTGGGPGTFIYYSRLHRTATAREDYYAHNDWLQSAGDLGIVGFVLLLATALHILSKGVWRFSQSISRLQHSVMPQSNTAAINLGALSAMVAFCVHSFFDFNLQIPANALLAAAVAGLLISPTSRQITSHRWRYATLVLIAVGSLGLTLSLYRNRNEWHWLKAENALLTNNLSAAYLNAKNGLAISPDHPRLQGLFSEIVMHQLATDPSGALVLLAEAERALRKAISLAPEDRSHYIRLVEVLLREGKYSEAISVAQKAISLAPKQAFPYELCGQAYELLGDLNNAEKMYESSTKLWNFQSGPQLLETVRKKIREQRNNGASHATP